LIIIGYGILISIKNPNIKINQKKTPIFPLILVALVLTGCFLFWLGVNIYFNNYTTDRHKFLMDKFEQNTSLLTESEFYNPTIPNTIGQGLYLSDLTGLTPKDLTDYTFRWTTNYGYFITWLPDEKRAIYLSNDTVIPGNKSFGKIFWTFSKEDIGKNKPPVSIRLKIENSSQIYQNIQTIFLTWSEIDIAQTEENHTKSIIFQAQKVDCPVTIGTSIYQNQSLQFAVIDKNLTDSQMIVNVASCNDLETLAMTITNAGCKGSTNHICKLCSQENNRLMNMNFFSSF
jgi:hypothetical protein